MVDPNKKLQVLKELAYATEKYNRYLQSLYQWEIDGRGMQDHLLQLKRELASKIMVLEREISEIRRG